MAYLREKVSFIKTIDKIYKILKNYCFLTDKMLHYRWRKLT